ncbi:thiol reductant ABC exporter subunit CydD [Streptomyces sp. 4N509B]|uniref:thiol reductant ABC exporter subunit CydD n=1 Tax=Streptomyces sp. 4N509B TaxID=3457413 RepID=UPI003FD12F6B
MTRPVDPRLLRYARATRGFLLASVALGLAGAGLVITQAVLLAEVIARAVTSGADVGELRGPLLGLLAVTVGRAAVAYLTGLAAHRASAAVKSELRLRLLDHASGTLGPAWLTGQRTGELTALATRGVDALDAYFSRYLPQLGLAAVVPVAVLARILTEDWIAAVTIAVTLPLIPLFMVLIGWATQAQTKRQWRALARLSGHFLDVVTGLTTLKVFGRATAQAEAIRTITGDYRRATLRTLRVAFLSSFALELLATVSVALVAVGVGMRLVHGDLDLATGLVVLILAPEAYLPLRQVGAEFHAAQEGLAAAEEVFDVLDTPPPPRGTEAAPDVRGATIAVERLVVRHEGRTADALAATSLTVAPGETLALTGPSGGGKSTLLAALLGFARPAAGRVLVGGRDLNELDLAGWHRQVAWVPQRPHLVAGTVAENVRLARPEADDDAVAAALVEAAASELDPRREVGDGGVGLSAGQRQRVALARAFLADRPLLLLDEPTAALDGATEAAVVAAIRRAAARPGRTVVLVTHRPALLAAADRVFHVEPRVPHGEPPASHGEPRVFHVEPSVAGLGRHRPTAAGPLSSAHAEPRAGAGNGPGGARTAAGRARPLARVRAAGAARRGRLALATVLGALTLASSVGLMATSGWLISRAWEQPPILYLMIAVTATRAFGIGRAVFRYAERLVGHDAVLRILAELRVTTYRRLARLAPFHGDVSSGGRPDGGRGHEDDDPGRGGVGGEPRERTGRSGESDRDNRGDRGDRGELLARLVSDVDALQDYFLRWLLPVAAAALVSLAAVAFTGWLLPAAGLALACGLLVAGVAVPALAGAVARRAERQVAPARGVLTSHALGLLTGTAELTVAGALPARRAAVAAADARLTALGARSAAALALGGGLTALTTGLTVTAAAWLGVGAVADGRLAGVWLATVVLVPLAAAEAVAGLPQAVQHRQRVTRAAERIHEITDARPAVREPARPVAAPASPFPLRVDGLAARYPGRAREGAVPALALDGIDLELTAGRRVAVVGPSGSGKSTLAHCLLRFLDPVRGGYTLGVGATPATELDGDAVRRAVGLCAQDAHLFASSLRENLRLARPDADEAALRAALSAARLLEWADGLPQGLDTPVGEHGARLSGGQRQRLALARALLADFPVLVLDEPAEHLDPPTADALTADLLAATQGRATVLITHRLAALSEETVDEVLVLDAGRVVQRGRYAALAAESAGPFRRMLDREAASEARRTGRAAAGTEPVGAGLRVGSAG